MAIGLLGKKLYMGQVFGDEGKVIPVTLIEAGPCVVVQKKTKERDGYCAIQLGYGEIKRPNRALKGHFGRLTPMRNLKEFRVESLDGFEVGQKIKVDIFQVGEYVEISGLSKGKGFSGGVKRWGWRGGGASHGSMFHRAPGSIGSSSDPSRVFKGKRLPGRMGNKKITLKRVEIVRVNPDENLIMVKGPTPGRRGTLLVIKKGR